MRDDRLRDVGRHRERVIHKGPTQELSALVVLKLFAQRGADALRDAAVDLTVHEQGIDHGSAVVRDPVAGDAHHARVAIHLDGGHVHARRERPVLRLVDVARLEPRLRARRQALAAVCLARDLGDAQAASGHAAHAVVAVLHLDVGLGGLEQMRGDASELLLQDARGFEHGAARHDRAATAGRAVAAVRAALGVAEDDADVLVRQPEDVGRHLGQRRANALADLDDAARDRRVTRRIDAHHRGLVPALAVAHRGHDLRRAHPGELDVAGQAYADQPPVRALARLPLPESVIARALERALEPGRVAPAVQLVAAGAPVRERLGRDEVAAADLGRIEPEAPRRRVHEALHDEDALLLAERTVRAERDLVGDDRLDARAIVADVVRPGQQGAGDEDRRGPFRMEMGAHVAADVRLEREERAVLVERRPGAHPLLAGVDGAREVLAARLDPHDGPVQAQRGQGDQHVFGVVVQLHTEAATDVGDDHDDAVLFHAQRGGYDGPPLVRRLARYPDRQLVPLAVVGGAGGAALQRRGGLARHRERRVDDGVSGGKHAIGIAGEDLPPRRQVVGPAVVQARGLVAHRLVDIGHRGQGRIRHVHALQRVLGHVAALGYDRRNGLTDVEDLVRGEDWIRRLALPRRHVEHGQLLERRHVGGGQDGQHAGHPLGRGEIARFDAGVGVRAAQHRHVDRAGQRKVGDVRALAAHESWIFLAAKRLADHDRTSWRAYTSPRWFVSTRYRGCQPRPRCGRLRATQDSTR